MHSRIRDLERFQTDKKRFQIAIDCVEGTLREEGQKLYADLIDAVETFDNTLDALMSYGGSQMHGDVKQATDRVSETKNRMEDWVAYHTPNIHV